MDVAVLTGPELALARRTEQGEAMDFGTQGGVIRAEVLRRMLLGLPVKLPDDERTRRVEIPSSGLRLMGARIAGELRLDDAAGPDGGPLPPLVLERCLIPAPILFRRAHLRHLSLAGSRLCQIDGEESVIAGPLDLSDVHSAEEGAAMTGARGEGLCWVELRGIRIMGRLRARRTRLVAPPARDWAERAGKLQRYALDLREARIDGALVLWPRFRALGGLSLRSARVDQDVVGTGAELLALEDNAFRAQGAHILGSVLLSNSFEGDRFTAKGVVSFLGARIGGTLEMLGASVESLQLAAAEIDGSALLRTESGGGVPLRFEATGEISLINAKIGSDLSMDGASVQELVAAGANIGGAAMLRAETSGNNPQRFEASGQISLLHASIGESLDMNGASVQGLVAHGADIGGSVLMRTETRGQVPQRFEAAGDIVLINTRIGGDLSMGGASVAGLVAAGANIRGTVMMRAEATDEKATLFEAAGHISFLDATIGETLDMSGAMIQGLLAESVDIGGSVLLRAKSSGGERQRFEAAGHVSFLNAKIGSILDMSGASVQDCLLEGADIGGCALMRAETGGTESQRFEAAGRISFLNTRIGDNLEMDGALVHRVLLEGAEIGGNVLLRAETIGKAPQRFEARDTIILQHAVIGGDLDMAGATVQDVLAGGAEIGGSVQLRAAGGVAFEAAGQVALRGVEIGSDFNLLGGILRVGLDAHNAEIGGNMLCGDGPLNVSVAGVLSLSGAKIDNRLLVDGLQCLGDASVDVNLTHARVGVLADQDGAGWGDRVRLLLEGFDYGRIASGRSPGAARLVWLSLQYPAPGRRPNREDYAPDAYDRLTRAFRASGAYQEARRITRERLRVERRLYTPWLFKPFVLLYELLFDFGLSPLRAIGTFVGCILILCGLVSLADHGYDPADPSETSIGWVMSTLDLPVPAFSPVLVLYTSTVNSLAMVDPSRPATTVPAIAFAEPTKATIEELPCGDQIEPLLYALDVFVPALEIHQEGKCEVTSLDRGLWWRIGRAGFAILGWVVTALTILTVSGVLRRHLED